MKKMKKGNIEIKKGDKIKLNVSLVLFVDKVIKEKLMNLNKEKLREIYLNEVKLKSSKNINRVFERVKRENLRGVLLNVLKEKNLSFEMFDKIGSEIVEKIREKKNNSYLIVE